MTAKILLVNPPIFDFAAYDFWLKPYGLLSVAGKLRGHARLTLFDYLDRLNPFVARQKSLESDTFGRGKFYHRIIPPPKCLINIPRYFRRFGLPRHLFQNLLKESPHFDFVLVQTMMTYWYPGLQEVIHDLRTLQPKAKIILGGVYATLCRTRPARNRLKPRTALRLPRHRTANRPVAPVGGLQPPQHRRPEAH